MKITYYGHNFFSIQIGATSILVDPFWSGTPHADQIDPTQIDADYILLTHGHADHCADLETILKHRPSALLIAMADITDWYQRRGITHSHPMNIGGQKAFDFGRIKMVNAVHSSTMPDGSAGGASAGYLILNDQHSLYIAGDTALHSDMKLIPIWAPKLDVAILPIGDNFTMGAHDAAIAAEWIGAQRVIGCHFDTFGYIQIDHDQAMQFFSARNLHLNLLNIGQSIEIN